MFAMIRVECHLSPKRGARQLKRESSSGESAARARTANPRVPEELSHLCRTVCAGRCEAAAALDKVRFVRLRIRHERAEGRTRRRICAEHSPLLLEVDFVVADVVMQVKSAGSNCKEFARILGQRFNAPILPEVTRLWPLPSEISAKTSYQFCSVPYQSTCEGNIASLDTFGRIDVSPRASGGARH